MTSLTVPFFHVILGCEPVILPEDVSLAGFVPLLANSQEPMFVMPSADMVGERFE